MQGIRRGRWPKVAKLMKDHDSWLPLNDLARALGDQGDELAAIVSGVVASGWLIQGPEHSAFEAAFAQYLGVSTVLGVASGTDALQLAMKLLMPTGRRVVVTTANAGGYSATAARQAGMDVRYADVDEDTHLATAETIGRVLEDSVGVVVVTHLYGRAADVAPIRALCAERGVKVLEDCAQAAGAATSEGMVGSLGDAAAFSFYPTKNLGAIGDGGAIAVHTDDDAGVVRELRQYGWRGKYNIERLGGVNSRLDELQAAVLRMRLPHLDRDNRRRREIITHYAESASDAVTVLRADGAEHVGHLGVVVAENRESVQGALAQRRIRTDIHYPTPDHLQPAFAREYRDLTLPVTEKLAAGVLSVPLFPEMTDAEVEYVADALSAL